MSGAPPPRTRRFLERTLPPEVRDGIVGDLDEVYRTRRGRNGALVAGLWYAGHALAISGRFAAERVREAITPRGLSTMGLDLKLGLRMLVKYPMLTLVGGLAIMSATAIGVGISEFVRDMIDPRLPLDEGDRIVRLYQNDAVAGGSAAATMYDLEVWRESVSSLEDLGAYMTLEQGLLSDREEAGTVRLARVSPSAFRVTRVPPQLGRFLIDADERPEAPPVVVLGWDAWQTLLGGDPDVVGRIVQLGGTPTTVVGVMPEGYGFPAIQNAWVPFGTDADDLHPETARRAALFARLAPGATLESAQSELDVAGGRLAAEFPDMYEHLTPAITEFARRALSGYAALFISAVRLVFILLLMIPSATVAALVFARTVMREGEIAVRTSLGASRRRIVLQFFAEALVLVGGATAIGMGIAWFVLDRMTPMFFNIQQEPQPPFWWNNALSPTTVLYAAGLALVGAVIVGVLPALKATGGSVHHRLGEHSAGGAGGLKLGGVWTVVIVLQVALSVAVLPIAVFQGARAQCGRSEPCGAYDGTFAADQYLTAQLGRDLAVPPRTEDERLAFLERSRQLFQEVRDSLAADPAVDAVAFASGLSAMNHVIAPIEFVAGSEGPLSGYTRVLLVDATYLGMMGATVVAGEPLTRADFRAGSRSVVVNEAFVDRVLGGRNAVGGQIRFPEREGEAAFVRVPAVGSSVDVVGVVTSPEIDEYGPGAHPVIYAPLDLAPVDARAAGLVGMSGAPSTQIFVRLRPEAGPMAGQLYAIVSEVDPSLHLSQVGTTADAWEAVHMGERLAAWIFMTVAGIILLLSVTGVYALMSFTVSIRTREIAIRTAVGGSRRQIMRAVFGRAVLQLLAGIALGTLVAGPVLWSGIATEGLRSLVIVATVLIGAGLAACFVPIRRAMGVDPALAMKAD